MPKERDETHHELRARMRKLILRKKFDRLAELHAKPMLTRSEMVEWCLLQGIVPELAEKLVAVFAATHKPVSVRCAITAELRCETN